MPDSHASGDSGVRAVARGVLSMLGAATEDTVAAVDVLRLTGVEPPPRDWFAVRNPDYIRATLPAMRTLSDIYFRGEVSGLERIPPEGPVLLVGNHSGGTVIADTFVFAQAFYDRFGAERSFHQLAHDLVFRVPGLRTVGVVDHVGKPGAAGLAHAEPQADALPASREETLDAICSGLSQ